MEHKEKRKYVKSGKYSKHTSETPQSNSMSVETPIKDIIPEPHLTRALDILVPNNTPKVTTFEDLPLSEQKGIERILTYRHNLGLPDDSIERKQKAVNYFRIKCAH